MVPEVRRPLCRAAAKKRSKVGSKWHLDEVFIKINGVQHYLWRAVDQHGATIDILVQPRRDRWAALRFFRKLLDAAGRAPRVIVTGKLRSYGAAKRKILPNVEHRQSRYLNNRAENSHQPTRVRERQNETFFNHPNMPNSFSLSSNRSTPLFVPAVTYSRLLVIGCVSKRRSIFGTRLPTASFSPNALYPSPRLCPAFPAPELICCAKLTMPYYALDCFPCSATNSPQIEEDPNKYAPDNHGRQGFSQEAVGYPSVAAIRQHKLGTRSRQPGAAWQAVVNVSGVDSS